MERQGLRIFPPKRKLQSLGKPQKPDGKIYATVSGRSLTIDIWSHRLVRPRTEPSQGLNTGSNPVGTTSTYAIPPKSCDTGVTRISVDNPDPGDVRRSNA